ncbi:MAG: ribose ABC transporter permease [Armatimonadetes bacterium]|nr:ribose ABC transporter permease [Armatimonadota bacterium]MBS1728751.1 ABC transporter permease [Armatimonadota bacterium]
MKKFIQQYGALIALIVLIIFNTIWQGHDFYAAENIRNILAQNSAKGMIAIGMTLVIIAGGIDLSVGSMVGLLSVLILLGLNKWNSMPAAYGIAIFGGILIGFFNGLLVSLGRIAPFVATLAGLGAFRSLAMAITNAGQVTTTNPNFENIANGGFPLPGLHTVSGDPLVIYWPILVFFGLGAIAAFILNRSVFGRRLIATGANEQASEYSGIKTNSVKLASYSLLGLMTGIAALCLTARYNSASSATQGLYYELDAIAAVVIGGTSLSGGRGRIGTTVIGVLILGLVDNMLTTKGIDSNWQGCVKGVIILLAVLLQRNSSRK